MRRVVVTGLGMVSPLASGVEATWRRLLACESGAGRIGKFDTTDFPCKVGAEVPRTNGYAGGAAIGADAFNPDDFVSPKEQRRIEDFIVFGIAAAQMAVDDSGLKFETAEEQERAAGWPVFAGHDVGELVTGRRRAGVEQPLNIDAAFLLVLELEVVTKARLPNLLANGLGDVGDRGLDVAQARKRG